MEAKRMRPVISSLWRRRLAVMGAVLLLLFLVTYDWSFVLGFTGAPPRWLGSVISSVFFTLFFWLGLLLVEDLVLGVRDPIIKLILITVVIVGGCLLLFRAVSFFFYLPLLDLYDYLRPLSLYPAYPYPGYDVVDAITFVMGVLTLILALIPSTISFDRATEQGQQDGGDYTI